MQTMKRTIAALVIVGVSAVCLGQEYNPFGKGKADAKARPPERRTANSIASIEFVDTPITTIFKMISDLTGWSIITSPEVTKSPPKVNIWIKNMSPREALDQVLLLSSLIEKREGNTIQIMTFDEYARLYGLDRKIIPLKHADGKVVATMLKPCVAETGRAGTQARVLFDEQGNSIILLVPSPLIDSLVRLVKAVDVPSERLTDEIRIVRLKHAEATTLAPSLESFLGQASHTQARRGPVVSAGRVQPTTQDTQAQPEAGSQYQVIFMVEPKLNVIVMRGNPRDVKAAIDLLESLDVAPGLLIRSYELRYIDAQQAINIANKLLVEESAGSSQGGWRGQSNMLNRRSYTGTRSSSNSARLRIAATDQGGRLVVEGSLRDHEKVAEIISAVDKPVPSGAGSVRTYRLENSKSSEVAKVLQELIAQDQKGEGSTLQLEISGSGRSSSSIRRLSPPAGSTGSSTGADSASREITEEERRLAVQVVSAETINAVIIRAPASLQDELATIVQDLDRPRDQVLLDVTLVTVRTDDTFSLGVELGASNVGGGGPDQITFTSFGLGAADTATGQLGLAADALTGLNFALINAEDLSIIVHALQTVGDVEISTSPRLLAHDNAVAELTQTSEEPYQVLSQGETTTTTGLGGFVTAGTIIQVVPYVSSCDWIRLAYKIEFSSFSARVDLSLPPPKRQNTLSGTVRIPADRVVVLGGITGEREDRSVSSVPFLGKIPGFGELFKLRASSRTKETTYVFIRPVILRDPAFRDLMFLSREMIAAVKVQRATSPENPLKMLPEKLPLTKPEKADETD